MKPSLRFILTYARKSWEMRYFCFCLFRADRINAVLLWLLIPISLATYYIIDGTKDSGTQWYIYFTSQQFYITLLSVITWNNFRGSPHSGIATAVLVKALFAMVAEILGINNKFIWLNTAWQVLMYALIGLALKHYITRARKDI